MLSVFVEGIGVYGPGLSGWEAAAAVLRGEAPLGATETALPALDLLPPAERRRTSPVIKLALACAHAALAQSGRDPSTVATVFGSSGGDGDTIHAILKALSTREREVSPTRFHNSVHNAPSGYWALATACREPSTTLCGHDWTFEAALLEAATQVAVDRRAVALVVYDRPYPEPLNTVRPIEGAVGTALLLAPEQSPRALARLDVALTAARLPETRMDTAALERLRLGNPAARSLPLLALLARGASGRVHLDTAAGGTLGLSVGSA